MRGKSGLRFQASGFRLHSSLARAGSTVIFLVMAGVCGTVGGEVAKAGDDGAAISSIKVGDEATIMADGPGKTRRALPAVAFGKDIYLAVWQEGWHGEGGSSRIFAARVGLDLAKAGQAVVLDAKGIEVAPCKTGVQENPRVAFFGGVFLVVWQDFRNGKDCDVLGARVSPKGKVLDAQPIRIAAGTRSQVLPDVAADDKGFMVVWHGYQGEDIFPKIFAARIGPDGTMGEAVAVIDGAGPQLAWNGKEYLLVYFTARGNEQGNPRRAWARMDTAGKHLPAKGNNFVWGISRYSICGISEKKGWVIACHEGAPNFWGRSVGIQRVINITPDGKVAADSPTAKTKTYIEGQDAANFLDTSWKKKGKEWPYGGNALAPAGQYCMAVWQRNHSGRGEGGTSMSNADIRASRVDRWKPLEKGGVAVAVSAANERNPALAGNGAGKLLCVYEKSLDGTTRICAKTIETQ